MEREGEVVVQGHVEIDRRQPFRSVKEAVMLFGEKFLAQEIYAKQLQKVQTKASCGLKQPRIELPVTIEVEETKQNLQKTKEEATFMAHCLQSLKEELELTEREIQQLKTREWKQNPEIEELKFIENSSSSKVELRTQFQEYDYEIEFQKKRSVKFATTPLLTMIINVETSPSQRKKKLKNKSLIPLFGGLFSKKKGNQVNKYS